MNAAGIGGLKLGRALLNDQLPALSVHQERRTVARCSCSGGSCSGGSRTESRARAAPEVREEGREGGRERVRGGG